jgi:16S rRNA processing protein RimM
VERVSIGRVLAARGVRGELRVAPAARDLSRFARLARVYLEGPAELGGSRTVLSARQHNGCILLKLEGIETPEQARALTGREVLVDADDAVALGADEYFVHDLVGLEVVTDSGRLAGLLEEVLEGPANDVYVVRGPFGELMVPAVGSVVLKVDLRVRRMLIHDLPGMLEPDVPV